MLLSSYSFFFFFNDTATTEIYTLSLHDALPICARAQVPRGAFRILFEPLAWIGFFVHPASLSAQAYLSALRFIDRKSTRLNSSHLVISYAVFCLKKKKTLSGHRLLQLSRDTLRI